MPGSALCLKQKVLDRGHWRSVLWRGGQVLLLDLPDHPGLRSKLMGGGVDLDAGPDHDVIASAHLVTVQNGAQDV